MLKILGAAYLLWLGVHMLRAAARSNRETVVDGVSVAPHQQRLSTYLRQGILSNALNPKVALFFVTLLPQFLSADSPSPRADALLLSVVFASLYVLWFGLYVLAVDGLGRWLRRPRVKARIEQVTGVLLLAVAVRLAAASH